MAVTTATRVVERCAECNAFIRRQDPDEDEQIDGYEDVEDVDSAFGEYRRIWVRVYERICSACGAKDVYER